MAIVVLSAAVQVGGTPARAETGGGFRDGDHGREYRHGVFGAHRFEAAGTIAGHYQGRTSQGREISFRVARGHLTGLRVAVEVVCPSRRVWQVTAAMSSPIEIVDSRFGQSFTSHRPGAAGTATVKGSIRRGRVTGTVRMRRYIAPEHRYCSGSASFTVRRNAARPDLSGPRPPAFTAR